jgi:hypothetical protein
MFDRRLKTFAPFRTSVRQPLILLGLVFLASAAVRIQPSLLPSPTTERSGLVAYDNVLIPGEHQGVLRLRRCSAI